ERAPDGRARDARLEVAAVGLVQGAEKILLVPDEIGRQGEAPEIRRAQPAAGPRGGEGLVRRSPRPSLEGLTPRVDFFSHAVRTRSGEKVSPRQVEGSVGDGKGWGLSGFPRSVRWGIAPAPRGRGGLMEGGGG